MKSRNRIVLLTGLVPVLMAAVGCGVIPSQYRGKFQDSTNGVQLELSGRSGTFTRGGKVIQSKAGDLKFDNLIGGQAGIYVSPNATDDKKLDVYWVNPDASSRQAQADMVWFDSEVIYTKLDLTQKDKVKTIEFFHCDKGTVLLDTIGKNYQIGCPATTDDYQLQRTE